MKKIIQICLMAVVIMAVSAPAFSQKKIKSGIVKFELDAGDSDSPEMAMMAGSTLDFYFTDKKQKMDMSMMGGLFKIQTIVPTGSPKEAIMLFEMMGQKIQVTDMDEEALEKNNSFMNLEGIEAVEYDEKDKKEIAGYPCYKATVTTKDGQKIGYYITEKIQPPAPVNNKNAKQLKGYPLEINVDTGQGFNIVFKAKEVSGDIKDSHFEFPAGEYQKMTMAEFEETMGNMGGMGK